MPVVLLLSVLSTGVASAQTYAAIGGGTVTASGCSGITHDLARGSSDASTGGDVSRLQSFLIAQNYPGGGAWMLTGFYGAATQQAVLNFQTQRGIARTGIVDATTRAAMGTNCGVSSYVPVVAPTYVSTPSYITPSYVPSVTFGSPYSNLYSNQCGYGSFNCSLAGTPVINRLSADAGSVGTIVTIYGSGFSQGNNAVHFGPGVIASVMSVDGTSLSFTVPSYLTGYGSGATVLGTYNISVSNANGAVSNQVSFTVNSLIDGGTPNVSIVTSPATLGAGTAGTWSVLVTGKTGVYYTLTTHWGDENTTGFTPTVQSFALNGPQTINLSHVYATSGSYTVTFTLSNSLGAQYSSSVVVSVTGSSTNGGTPILSSITPSQGRAGTLVILQGANFAPSGNKVHFGQGGSMNVSSSNGGTIIYFTIPYTTSACDLAGSSCNPIAVTSGSYPVSVETGSGTSVILSFTVTQ